MNGSRFDTLTRWTARRTTRRAAVGSAGTGLALLSLGRVGAQEATPVVPQQEATPVAIDDIELLFVQTAGPTTLEPGADDVHTLTMTEATAQTLYFANRPDRTTGAMPTETFVAVFPEMFATSPPNATLLGHGETGTDEEEAVVVELLAARYDDAAATVSYDVRILGADAIGDRTFESEPLTALDTTQTYTEAHLFINDAELTIDEECMQACSCETNPMLCISGAQPFCYLQCVAAKNPPS